MCLNAGQLRNTEKMIVAELIIAVVDGCPYAKRQDKK